LGNIPLTEATGSFPVNPGQTLRALHGLTDDAPQFLTSGSGVANLIVTVNGSETISGGVSGNVPVSVTLGQVPLLSTDVLVVTLTDVPTPTPTETPTNTPTVTPTNTETPTNTPTNTETPTPTPTITVTPTSTDLSLITTFTISGCSSLNVFVADLGPSALAPGDVFYFDFTGGTPSGCYSIVNKIDAVPTDGSTPLYFYASCTLCEEAYVTPTPTPSVTNTPTPSVTPTLTPTNTETPTPTPTFTQTPTELVFLAQEDYFTIQQEDGFNIFVT